MQQEILVVSLVAAVAALIVFAIARRFEAERDRRDRVIIEGTIAHVLERLESGASPSAIQLTSEVVVAVRMASRSRAR